ncbi:MAG: OmpA family protein [Lachnospiraceae bacterium]|nr:OmpA family protein [Lachnospiraceae bacterium]
MARHGKRRREDEETSYWLSYSDMMAGLLLMFVIIISFTMMQSKMQYEEDARQLRAQQEKLELQQSTLEEQQTTLEEQQSTMESQELTLTEQEEALKSQQEELEKQKQVLESQTKQMEEQQKKLEEAQKKLDSQTKELKKQQKTAATQQKALDEKQATVDQQQSQLAQQQSQLEEQQKLLAEQTKTLEDQEKELAAKTTQVEEQQGQIEYQQKQMQALIGIRTELVEELRQAFEGTAKVSVDSKTGAIMFDSSVLFDFNQADLRIEGEDFLKSFLPDYFNILLGDEFRDYVSEVIIEGHTDTDGDYITNLELSQQRALAVASYCLQDEGGVLNDDVVSTLREIVTANGKSYSDPIYNEDGTINMDASRRVEVKFRLKEEEMVEQMMEILNG